MIKQELYAWLKYPRPETGEEYPTGYCHFPEYEEEFFRQITAEYLSMKDVKGRKVFEWVQIRPRNEALDTVVYARAATALLQIDKFTAEDWDRLENIVVPKGTNTKPSNGGKNSSLKNTAPARRRRTISKGVSIE